MSDRIFDPSRGWSCPLRGLPCKGTEAARLHAGHVGPGPRGSDFDPGSAHSTSFQLAVAGHVWQLLGEGIDETKGGGKRLPASSGRPARCAPQRAGFWDGASCFLCRLLWPGHGLRICWVHLPQLPLAAARLNWRACFCQGTPLSDTLGSVWTAVHLRGAGDCPRLI